MDPKDRVSELIIAALRKALAGPGEQRLYRAGKLGGLFPGRTGSSALAADRALAETLFRRTRIETKGKTSIDWVEITPQGVEFLHQHESPLHALHELHATLCASQHALPGWLESMRGILGEIESRLTTEAVRWRERLDAMEQRLVDTLRRLEAALPLVPPEVLDVHPWAVDALNYLDRRRSSGVSESCPLPELFLAISALHPTLTIAGFHDGLRRLHQRRALALRPTDDPTHMTRPEFALLEGDGVYYLATR